MLEEAWHWLRVSGASPFQRLGYRKEAAALLSRHRRCAAAWAPHIELTRRTLLDSARRCCTDGGRGGRAVVLGAGLLRDVPCAELLEHFDEMVLADVAFHPEARKAQRRHAGRLRLAVIDITGYLEALATDPGTVPPPTRRHRAPLDALLAGSRWMASVNLLTQLPLLPGAWLRQHGVGAEATEQFAAHIMVDHLQMLAEYGGNAVIVAEAADQLHDRSGKIVESHSRSIWLARHLRRPPWQCIAQWQWLVNPPGELPDGLTESREIVALHRDALPTASHRIL